MSQSSLTLPGHHGVQQRKPLISPDSQTLAIVLIWVVACVILSVIASIIKDGNPSLPMGPDDYMRLVQIRDLLSGQGWYDISQHRIDPPHGGDMHWSRIVDLPIATLILLFKPLLGQARAETLAMMLVPLLLLLPLLLVLARITQKLTSSRPATMIAVAFAPASWASYQFLPTRIDHHGWQILLAMLCAMLLLMREKRHSALFCGMAAATWISISIEGLPFSVLFAAIYAWFNLESGDRKLIEYMAGLAGFSLVLMLATHDPAGWLQFHGDAISWPHIAAFISVCLTLLIATGTSFDKGWKSRLVMLGIAGAAAALCYFIPAGRGALDPFSNLDPLTRNLWYKNVLEGLPITVQNSGTQIMMIVSPLGGIAGLVYLWRKAESRDAREDIAIFGFLLVTTTLMSFDVFRIFTLGQILALPGLAALLAAALERVGKMERMAGRVTLSALILFLGLPSSQMVVSFTLVNVLAPAKAKQIRDANDEQTDFARDIETLNQLPPTTLFADINRSPDILYQTRHSVIATGHHRNHEQIRQLLSGFTAPPEKACAIINATSASHVVIFTRVNFSRAMKSYNSKGLMARLLDGQTPAWLIPAPGMSNKNMKVYRILNKCS